jgi:hypothetical protein
MKETQVWGLFKLAWPHHADRQEPGLGAGQPDVVLLDRRGMPGLVELKAPEDVILNPNQWVWHEIWWASNGRTVVVTCDRFKIGEILWSVFTPLFKPKRVLKPVCLYENKFVMVRAVAETLRLEI